jgi:hypothetical protein
MHLLWRNRNIPDVSNRALRAPARIVFASSRPVRLFRVREWR